MANQLYHYGYSSSPTYGGTSPSSPSSAVAAASISSGRYLAAADMYYPQRKDSSLLYSSYAASDTDIGPPGVTTRISSAAVGPASSTATHLLSQASWPAAMAAAAAAAANAADPTVSSIKRASDG